MIDYGAGWVSFVTTILMIGIFTALIGDVASHFGCMIGLKDAVNAISFIAMGTSVPGVISFQPPKIYILIDDQ